MTGLSVFLLSNLFTSKAITEIESKMNRKTSSSMFDTKKQFLNVKAKDFLKLVSTIDNLLL